MKLRPHHITFLRNYRDIQKSLQEGETPEEKVYNQTILNQLKAYGPKLISFLDKLSARIDNNPEESVEIANGRDDICRNCGFKTRCLQGDYSAVREAYARQGVALGDGNPITADKSISEALKLDPSRKYSVRELFL